MASMFTRIFGEAPKQYMAASAPPAPVLPPEPPPPQYEGAEVQAARDKQRKQAALASGRASTMATGPLGLAGPAPVLRQTLGGR